MNSIMSLPRTHAGETPATVVKTASSSRLENSTTTHPPRHAHAHWRTRPAPSQALDRRACTATEHADHRRADDTRERRRNDGLKD